jgi:hypothetical protein
VNRLSQNLNRERDILNTLLEHPLINLRQIRRDGKNALGLAVDKKNSPLLRILLLQKTVQQYHPIRIFDLALRVSEFDKDFAVTMLNNRHDFLMQAIWKGNLEIVNAILAD